MSAIHLDESTLLRFVAADVDAKEKARVKRHIAACRHCSEALKGTRKLDKRLRTLGPRLAFGPGDPLAERPVPRLRLLSELGFDRLALSAAVSEAVTSAATKKGFLLEASRKGEEAIRSAVSALRADQMSDRFTLAHALEESLQRVAAVPREGLMLAEETLRGLAAEPHIAYAEAPASRMTPVEYAVPLTDLLGLARLLAGAANVWMAEFGKAEESLIPAYRHFAKGRGSDHHFAWVELYASQCRSFLGRPEQGLALAERALATFRAYELELDLARTRNARGIALYYRCRFEDALREFRWTLPVFAKHERWNEFVSTMGSIGFALMELGRRKEAIKEYAKATERATRADALSARSQLQLDIRTIFHNEGRWRRAKASRVSKPVLHLPPFGGSTFGREHADKLLAAAAEENGLEKASALIQELEKEASRGYAYLFFCQMAILVVAKRPATYLGLARKLHDAARSLPYRLHRGPAQPVCRESVMAEAALLESHSLNSQGLSSEAREIVQKARENFAAADDDSFSTALCDFYEGSAASFEGDYRGAWKLLKGALAEFQLYDQQNWVGRTQATLGILLSTHGLDTSALYYYDEALRNLHPKSDEMSYGGTLANRGYSLVKLHRFDAAKSTYAKALRIARQNQLTVFLFMIRYGLATIELQKGHPERALSLFETLAADARREDLVDRVVTAELRVAECLGRLGREEGMRGRVDRLRETFGQASDTENPGLLELFNALDKGELTAGLVAYVAAYVEDLDRGTSTSYQPFRLIAGGR